MTACHFYGNIMKLLLINRLPALINIHTTYMPKINRAININTISNLYLGAIGSIPIISKDIINIISFYLSIGGSGTAHG